MKKTLTNIILSLTLGATMSACSVAPKAEEQKPLEKQPLIEGRVYSAIDDLWDPIDVYTDFGHPWAGAIDVHLGTPNFEAYEWGEGLLIGNLPEMRFHLLTCWKGAPLTFEDYSKNKDITLKGTFDGEVVDTNITGYTPDSDIGEFNCSTVLLGPLTDGELHRYELTIERGDEIETIPITLTRKLVYPLDHTRISILDLPKSMDFEIEYVDGSLKLVGPALDPYPYVEGFNGDLERETPYAILWKITDREGNVWETVLQDYVDTIWDLEREDLLDAKFEATLINRKTHEIYTSASIDLGEYLTNK